MKFTVEQRALKAAIGPALGAVPSKSSLPILYHLVFVAEGDTLRVRGSDYDLQAEVVIPARVEEPGRATAEAKTFANLLKNLPDTEVTFSETPATALLPGEVKPDERRLYLIAGNGEYDLQSFDAEEAPELPEPKEPVSFFVPGGLLKTALARCLVTASTDPSRPQLTGLNLRTEHQTLHVCGAEMARLSKMEIPLETAPSTPDRELNVILPANAARVLIGMLDETEEPVEITASLFAAIFRYRGATISSKLIDGKFPDFNKVIPKDTPNRATVDVKDLTGAVRRALFVAEKSNRIQFTYSEDRLLLQAASGGTGKGKETMRARLTVDAKGDGEPLDVAMDGKLLLTFLGLLEEGEITLEGSAPLAPWVIHPTEEWTYIQMPMHLK